MAWELLTLSCCFAFLRVCVMRRAPTLEEKRQFRANLYRITSDDLGEIVKILEEKSPDAMDRVRTQSRLAGVHASACAAGSLAAVC